LAFHNIEGKPFVITYTIDGDISSLTQWRKSLGR
jgi:hypothetical protein